jgi:hypothetical protein
LGPAGATMPRIQRGWAALVLTTLLASGMPLDGELPDGLGAPGRPGIDVDAIKSLGVLKTDEFGTYPGFLMPAPSPSTVKTRDREPSTHSLHCRQRRRLTPIASLRH